MKKDKLKNEKVKSPYKLEVSDRICGVPGCNKESKYRHLSKGNRCLYHKMWEPVTIWVKEEELSFAIEQFKKVGKDYCLERKKKKARLWSECIPIDRRFSYGK